MLGDDSSSGVESVVGREAELEAIESVCRRPPDGGSVLLVGAAGIGKTALWDAGVRLAVTSGLCVLAARPRTALEAALLRVEYLRSIRKTRISKQIARNRSTIARTLPQRDGDRHART